MNASAAIPVAVIDGLLVGLTYVTVESADDATALAAAIPVYKNDMSSTAARTRLGPGSKG